MRLRILLDLDGVVANLVYGKLQLEKGRGLWRLLPDDWEPAYWNHRIMEDIETALADVAIHRLTPTYKGVNGFLRGLAQDYDVTFCTARKEAICGEHTLKWLCDRTVGEDWPLMQIMFDVDKMALAPEPYTVLIDDNLEYCNAYADKGGKAILVDRPWNQGKCYRDVTRCYSWVGITQVLRALQGQLDVMAAPKNLHTLQDGSGQWVFAVETPQPVGPTVHTFPSGALRYPLEDVRYDLITPYGLERLARVYAYGAKKYDDRNWEKGIPFSNLLNHAIRHLLYWERGEKSDPNKDDLAAAVWNLMAILHFEALGRTDLDDVHGGVYGASKTPTSK